MIAALKLMKLFKKALIAIAIGYPMVCECSIRTYCCELLMYLLLMFAVVTFSERREYYVIAQEEHRNAQDEKDRIRENEARRQKALQDNFQFYLNCSHAYPNPVHRQEYK